MQIRMMALGFGQLRYPIDRFDHFHKILEANGSLNPFPIGPKLPVRDGSLLGFGPFERTNLHAPLTG
jgi:hypothetical protein